MYKPVFHFPAFLKKAKRGGPAVILPKDAGMILAYAGIGKSSLVVEAGSGSGFLTCYLARIAKKVITYEIKAEFQELAKKNVLALGLDNVEFKFQDVTLGIDETEADAVVLDLPESFKAVSHAYAALKKEGTLVGYLPNVEQAKEFHLACQKQGFSDVFMLENIVREYDVREFGVRPQHFGLHHTAYLVFARK